MGLFFSFIAFLVIFIIGYLAGNVSGLHYVFGVVIPYIAIVFFIVGFIARIIGWAKSPVPFRIPTTCGQQKSLDFIKQNKFDSPYTKFQTWVRMFLEVLTFRSLFRNTTAELKDGSKLVYGESKWLWLFSILFHYSFLVIFIRHFRFFTDPVPGFVQTIQTVDEFLQIGVPLILLTNIAIVAGLFYLLLRRIFNSKIRYISQPADYFPLFLILGIVLTGMDLRYLAKTDLQAVKDLAYGLFVFKPVIKEGISPVFWSHFFMVCILLIYFPMSKLMHMGGVFLSPTRNQANNSRAHRHVNPWNPEVEFHTYEEYEDEFRDVMIDADMPVDKEGKDVK